MIKKLQNNFTTQEQSKRLLELGVPADSANLYNVIPTGYIGFCRDETFSEISNEIISVSRTKYRQRYTKDDIIPCWSVGRLLEIFDICVPKDHLWANTQNPNVKTYGTYIDFIVSLYNFAIKGKCLDFSKLEE